MKKKVVIIIILSVVMISLVFFLITGGIVVLEEKNFGGQKNVYFNDLQGDLFVSPTTDRIILPPFYVRYKEHGPFDLRIQLWDNEKNIK
jgi:hypothetical protein